VLFFSHLYVEKSIESKVSNDAYLQWLGSRTMEDAYRSYLGVESMESWFTPLNVGLFEAALEIDGQVAYSRHALLQATGGNTQQMHELVVGQLNELDYWLQDLPPRLLPVEEPSAALSAMRSKLMTSDWLVDDESTLVANHRRLHQFLAYAEAAKLELLESNIARIIKMERDLSRARREMDVLFGHLWELRVDEGAAYEP